MHQPAISVCVCVYARAYVPLCLWSVVAGKNIKDFVALNGDKAIEACMKSREESKSDKFLPKRIRRLVKETPRIRNELSKSGDFTFRNANFGKALDTIRPIMPKTSLQRSRFGRPVEK